MLFLINWKAFLSGMFGWKVVSLGYVYQTHRKPKKMFTKYALISSLREKK